MASKKVFAASVVIAANVFLILAKAAVAFLTGSIAVLATLFDSVFDLVGSLIAYFGVREAEKPPDAEHLYGHKKIENLSSLAQMMLIGIVAASIIFEALKRVSSPQKIVVSPLDLGIIAVTIAVDVGLALYLTRKSRALESIALKASAGNYLSDVFQNSIALLGLFFAGAGWLLADPVAAVLLALLMLRVVYKIGLRSANELIDVSPPRRTLDNIGKTILSTKGVKGFHKLRARQLENKVFLDVDIQVSPGLSVEEAHALAHKLKKKLFKNGVSEAVIHVEPSGRGRKFSEAT